MRAELAAKGVVNLHGERRCGAHRSAPIDAFEQHRELRRRQLHRAIAGRRPHETASLQPLGEQAEALPVPVQQFDEVTTAATKAED